MANIDKAFSTEILSLDDVVLLTQGAPDPSIGAGYEAPIGSVYLRTNGELYQKTGLADVDWTLNLATGGGGSGITELTGDVTAGPGTGSVAATIALDSVTYAKMQNVVSNDVLLGNIGGAGGIITELTASQVKTLLGIGVDNDQVIYVGKHGNDANDGKTLDKAVLTFGQAVTLAVAETPTIEYEWAILCLDGGRYVEDIALTTSFLILHAANAHLDGHLTVTDDVSVTFEHIHCPTSGNAIEMTTGTNSSYIALKYLETEGTSNGVVNNSGGILNVEAEYYKQTNGIGVLNSGITHADFQDWDIYGTSPIGVQNTGGTTNVRSANTSDRGATNSIGFDCNAGVTNAMISNIAMDVLHDVEVGAELNLIAGKATGTELNDGTANVLQASHELDGTHIPAGGTANQVLEKIDGTDYNVQWVTILNTGQFFHHNAALVQTFTAATTILFNTAIIADSDYTYSLGEVTINRTGWYDISYEVTADSTGGRTTSNHQIEVNGTLLPGSIAHGYHRSSANGEDTATANVLAYLTNADVVRVRSSGTASITTVANGCRLRIESK